MQNSDIANDAVSVVIAGLGGQGVVKASDILSDAAFEAGLDVKKSEIHGMSQRGGAVTSDVRFGRRVLSPMVPHGQAGFLVALASDQLEPNRWLLREDGLAIGPGEVDVAMLPSARCLNVAILGVLSTHLAIDEDCWRQAIEANLPLAVRPANMQAFEIGRRAGDHSRTRQGDIEK